MGDISLHLSRHEVACECACGFQTADHDLVYAIEDACIYFAHKDTSAERVAVHINSWCRCSEHDIAVQRQYKPEHWRPSGKRSEHLRGWATDFWLEYVYSDGTRTKVSDDSIADYLENKFPNRCGIGRYNGRTHLDMRPYKARWDNR